MEGNEMDYAVFANGTFWGVWTADSAAQAIQLAADEVGTDGNTEGMTAVDADDVDASQLA
jgi:hypothetical protein